MLTVLSYMPCHFAVAFPFACCIVHVASLLHCKYMLAIMYCIVVFIQYLIVHCSVYAVLIVIR